MKKDTLIAAITPLIIIAGLLYSGYTGGATGFAAAEPNNAFGTYYLDPSFSISMNYEMQREYEEAIAGAREAIEQCKAQKKIGDCLRNYIISHDYQCAQDDLGDIFYGIPAKYEECLNLEEDEAVCRISIGREAPDESRRKQYELLAASLVDEVSFELRDSGNSLMENAVDSPGVYYVDFDKRETRANSVSIRLDYRTEPRIESATSSDGKALSSMILYKKGGKVYFVEKSAESNFLLQRSIKKVNLPRKNAAEFCIRSGIRAAAFDAQDNEARSRDVTYRFAVKYPELDVPPPVTSIEAADKVKAENSIVLSWGKARWEDGSDAMNIEHYNAYCSERDFERNGRNEIDFGSAVPLRIFSDANPEQWKISVSECNGRGIEDGRAYYFAVTSATEEAESIATASGSAVSVDDIAPGIMSFTITNGRNARADSEDGSVNIEMSGSISVVPRRPEFNEDKDSSRQGTRIRDDESMEYLLYYSKIKTADNLDACGQDRCRIVSRSLPTSFSTIDSIGGEKFTDGEIYYFTLVARDEQRNIIRSIASPYQFTVPEQWQGLEDFRVE